MTFRDFWCESGSFERGMILLVLPVIGPIWFMGWLAGLVFSGRRK